MTDNRSAEKLFKNRIKVINIIVLFLLLLNPLESEMNNPMYIDFNELNSKAELVLICELKQAPPPFEILGTDFFNIVPADVLKGNLEKKSLLSVYFAYDSPWSPPPPAQQKTYLLFLKQGKMDDEQAPKDIVYYEPVNTWQGMVPLFNEASPACPSPGSRFFNIIKTNYALELETMLPDFITAVKAAYSGKDDTLPDKAAEIYRTLKLELIKASEKKRLQTPEQQ